MPQINTLVNFQIQTRYEYMPINQWNYGFAIIDSDSSGLFNVHNKKIVGSVVR